MTMLHSERILLYRYTEAYEREWRQKEKAARERVAATNRDLAQARAAQQAARVAAQADMARLEAQEFHRIVEENRYIEQQKLQKVTGCTHLCLSLYLQLGLLGGVKCHLHSNCEPTMVAVLLHPA